MKSMNTNILATATRLSDEDLLARLQHLAANEREATAQLVAHLAALESRPAVYAAQGYGSLFSYCTQALRLSEDAACNRIEAARACRRFPLILDLLATGEVNLTAVRLLGRHLTAENYEAVLARAKGRPRQQIEVLVAELAPRRDVLTSVRKLPTYTGPPPSMVTPAHPDGRGSTEATAGAAPAAFLAAPRPVIQSTAPQRYRVQFTIGQEAHERLRRLQALLRREIPDGGQCAYVAPSGRRCTETTFLEFHHLQAYAHQGPATTDNIALRCRRHNQYEAELSFGPGPRRSREGVTRSSQARTTSDRAG